MLNKLFQNNLFIAGILFISGMSITALVYPEVLIQFKSSFINWNDYCVEYEPTFVLTTFLYQGGIQLWDFFGQMPYFHTYGTLGLFKFPNVVTALTYYLLAPFSSNSSQFFHHVFAWGYLMSILFIRIVGIFLLLNTVTKNRYILTIGTVLGAVFFSPLAFIGGAFYRNFFPLAMYFVVRFFQGLQGRFLTAGVLFFGIVFGNELLHGAYLYLPMHFFILAGILWRIFLKPFDVNNPRYFWHSWSWVHAAWVAIFLVLVIAPYVYIFKYGLQDLAFGQNDSRISHPFSAAWYLHNPNFELGNPRAFFSSILNMQTTDTNYYLGIVLLFLAAAGLILSPNRLKYFFALTVFFFWLLSFPREGLSIGLIGHWINILTNPLKTIPRSPWLACGSMLPFVLIPLAVMGMEAVQALYHGKKYAWGKVALLGIVMGALLVNGFPFLSHEVGFYLVIASAVMWGAVVWLNYKDSFWAKKFLLISTVIFLFIDMALLVYQAKKFTAMAERKPAVLDVSPQSGMVGYDFENPIIFPYRYYYALHFSYNDEVKLWFPHSVSSDMHHVINQGLNYVYLNGYNPRHIEFVKWLNDPSMLWYLKQNGSFMFLADSAIKVAPDALSRICSAGLSHKIAAIEDPTHHLNLPAQWMSDINSQNKDIIQYDQVAGILEANDGQSRIYTQEDFIVYRLQLPVAFPQHLASSWFYPEQLNLRLLIETTPGRWQEFQSTQGELIRPNTFDVQNIKQGELRVALLKEARGHRYTLLYRSKANVGVEGLWRKEFDNLGITYHAQRDGWLIAHYPYDKKWRIFVDDKPVIYYRANESFIGFPITKGEHRILIQYWPDTPLRGLLLVSGILTTIGLCVLIWVALKGEQGQGPLRS